MNRELIFHTKYILIFNSKKKILLQKHYWKNISCIVYTIRFSYNLISEIILLKNNNDIFIYFFFMLFELPKCATNIITYYIKIN